MAYTPGLKVTEFSKIKKERRLSLLGEVLVKDNQNVKSSDVVAKAELPGKIYPMNIAGELGLTKPSELPELMLKKEGDAVTKGEVIAKTKGLFGKGWFSTEYESPVSGTISQISKITGQVIFNEPPIPIEMQAYIDGQISDVIDKEGACVNNTGVHIQGILGLGGETIGVIKMVANSSDQVVCEDDITHDLKDCIIICGSKITPGALKKAKEVGCKGVVSGGFDYQHIRDILGKDLGVAITGHEKLGYTLILTEGFGEIKMADRTFDLLKKYEGYQASINGATQIRAGVMRPEVIITHDKQKDSSEISNSVAGDLNIGDQIRVIRAPYFGKLGIVKDLPVELKQMESGTWVRALVAEVDGKDTLIPRANIEIIEK